MRTTFTKYAPASNTLQILCLVKVKRRSPHARKAVRMHAPPAACKCHIPVKHAPLSARHSTTPPRAGRPSRDSSHARLTLPAPRLPPGRNPRATSWLTSSLRALRMKEAGGGRAAAAAAGGGVGSRLAMERRGGEAVVVEQEEEGGGTRGDRWRAFWRGGSTWIVGRARPCVEQVRVHTLISESIAACRRVLP